MDASTSRGSSWLMSRLAKRSAWRYDALSSKFSLASHTSTGERTSRENTTSGESQVLPRVNRHAIQLRRRTFAGRGLRERVDLDQRCVGLNEHFVQVTEHVGGLYTQWHSINGGSSNDSQVMQAAPHRGRGAARTDSCFPALNPNAVTTLVTVSSVRPSTMSTGACGPVVVPERMC